MIKPYEGNEKYICISSNSADNDAVFPIISKLAENGYRVWFDDGSLADYEKTEKLAECINSCEICLVFISENYLNTKASVRELNFALLKDKMLISTILEPAEIPLGIEMQMSAFPIFNKYKLDETEYFSALFNDGVMAQCRDEIVEETEVQSEEESEEILVPVPSAEEQPKNNCCPSCGAETVENASFCLMCGTRLIADDAAAIAEAARLAEEERIRVEAEEATRLAEEERIRREMEEAARREEEERFRLEQELLLKLEQEKAQEMNLSVKVCSTCGAEVPATNKFCTKCGSKITDTMNTPVENVNIAVNLCNICGADLIPGSRFCRKCGADATAQSVSVPTVARCNVCGAEIASGNKFCTSCGAGVTQQPVAASVKHCSACGAELVGGKFCRKCGAPVDNGEEFFNINF